MAPIYPSGRIHGTNFVVSEKRRQPVFHSFEGGVTSIQSHPHIEHLLAVGRYYIPRSLHIDHLTSTCSYNDTVRLFDVRKPLKPLTEANVGGGAWRVKWHPHVERKHDLLVACMHDGFKVMHFNSAHQMIPTEDYAVVKRFDEHQSLAYGVDWSYAEDAQADTLIASGSFYDAKLHVWRG